MSGGEIVIKTCSTVTVCFLSYSRSRNIPLRCLVNKIIRIFICCYLSQKQYVAIIYVLTLPLHQMFRKKVTRDFVLWCVLCSKGFQGFSGGVVKYEMNGPFWWGYRHSWKVSIFRNSFKNVKYKQRGNWNRGEIKIEGIRESAHLYWVTRLHFQGVLHGRIPLHFPLCIFISVILWLPWLAVHSVWR